MHHTRAKDAEILVRVTKAKGKGTSHTSPTGTGKVMAAMDTRTMNRRRDIGVVARVAHAGGCLRCYVRTADMRCRRPGDHLA